MKDNGESVNGPQVLISLNLSTLKSDKHVFSLHNIQASSSKQVMRIIKLFTLR